MVFLVMLVSIQACKNPASSKIPDTPTSGQLKIMCDEGFAPILKNQVYTFQEIYPKMKIAMIPCSQDSAVQNLFNDCCKVICISRSLSPQEEEKFTRANIYTKATCIAFNAIAFTVPILSPDSSLSLKKILTILIGADSSYQIILDQKGSGITRFLSDSLLNGKPFGKNCHCVNSSNELIDVISKNSCTPEKQRSIGVLNFALISDRDDKQSQKILEKIRPLAIAQSDKDTAYFPGQANIQTRNYPFTHPVYLICRAGAFTPGTGFVAFVAGEKGQLMLLKAGLIPFYRQARLISIDVSPLSGS